MTFARTLSRAAYTGDVDWVAALLGDARVDPPPVDQRNMYSHALRLAAALRHVGIVRLLLDDGRADPAAWNSVVLRDVTCQAHDLRGVAAVCRVLLADERADPTTDRSAEPSVRAAARWRRRRHWLRAGLGAVP
jgi:hypothetical protein